MVEAIMIILLLVMIITFMELYTKVKDSIKIVSEDLKNDTQKQLTKTHNVIMNCIIGINVLIVLNLVLF